MVIKSLSNLHEWLRIYHARASLERLGRGGVDPIGIYRLPLALVGDTLEYGRSERAELSPFPRL